VAILPELHARGARRVLDLGCGVGRHALLLAEPLFSRWKSRERGTEFESVSLHLRGCCEPDFVVEGAEFVDDHPSSFQIGGTPYAPKRKHVSSRDRDFRPTRRRGFDDDNFETSRRSFGSTPGSSAQRFDAPSGPPVQAVVKWYNPDKGFGFVQLADGSGDAFLHVSVVERSGHHSVPPGATLEVRAGPGPKGRQVSEILSVDSSTAQQESPRRVRPERPMYPLADGAAVEESGTVKWYNAMKGFGFIASDRGGKDIFVHASALGRAGIAGLTEGQRVAVDVIDGRKGPEAAGLRLI
jgi:cold shock protein